MPMSQVYSERSEGSASRRRIGAPPGLVEMPPNAKTTKINTHLYNSEGYERHEGVHTEESKSLVWIDVCGLSDQNAIVAVAKEVGMDDLAIADIFHLDQQPHAEVADDLVQLVIKMPVSMPPFRSEQVTLILGAGYILSVRESDYDCLGQVRKRLEGGTGRIRSSSEYLFYAIIDAIIDSYFPILENYGDEIEELEEHIFSAPQDDIMRDIHALKRDLLDARRSLWPLRDAVSSILREDSALIPKSMRPFLRDCLDHMNQLLDIVETNREAVQGLIDLHMSALSNRMNEIMKVLTVIATVFIPMTFFTGLYGMNFDQASPYNMPELRWRFGYFFALSLMFVAAAIMLFFFWRVGWLFNSDKPRRRKWR